MSRRIATLALLLLFSACAGTIAHHNTASGVRVSVQEWSPTTVRIYCGSAQVRAFRPEGRNQYQAQLPLSHCDGVWAKAEVLGEATPRTSLPMLSVRPGESVCFTVPDRQHTIYAALGPVCEP